MNTRRIYLIVATSIALVGAIENPAHSATGCAKLAELQLAAAQFAVDASLDKPDAHMDAVILGVMDYVESLNAPLAACGK